MSNQPKELSDLLQQIKDRTTNPLKRAHLIAKLTKEKALNKKELAYLINKSPSYISNHLRLIQLPEVIKEALLSGIISEGHARALTFVSSKVEAIHLFEDIIRYNYSVRDTEKKVDKIRQFKRHYGKVAPDLKEQAQNLETDWRLKMHLSRQRQTLSLRIDFPLGVVGLRKLREILQRLSIQDN